MHFSEVLWGCLAAWGGVKQTASSWLKREIRWAGGKKENSSRWARDLKVRPQGGFVETSPWLWSDRSRSGSWEGVCICSKGRRTLWPLNRGILPFGDEGLARCIRDPTGVVSMGQEVTRGRWRNKWEAVMLLSCECWGLWGFLCICLMLQVPYTSRR